MRRRRNCNSAKRVAIVNSAARRRCAAASNRRVRRSFVTRSALQLALLVFVRPGELLMAEWIEFNLGEAEWRIPGMRMKMRIPHSVPLSSQAVEILWELQAPTGSGRFVFPGERSRDRPTSNDTVNAALRRFCYTNAQMTGHGFRSMASTLLNE